jgi:hypothetical protein
VVRFASHKRAAFNNKALLPPWAAYDFLAQDTDLVRSMFEDPSGGLSMANTVEMAPAEIEQLVSRSRGRYDPTVYGVLFTPLVDLLDIVLLHNIVPQVKPEASLARWFADPQSLLRNPKTLRDAMGESCWGTFCDAVKAFCEQNDAASPLRRCCSKFGVNADAVVPFLRQLVLDVVCSTTDRAFVQQTVPSALLGLANGKGPPELKLPVEANHCLHCVTWLLISVSQEAGNCFVGLLGIQMLKAHNEEVPFAMQKALTNIFAASQRIRIDWDTRSSGKVHSHFRQLTEYIRQVGKDCRRNSLIPSLDSNRVAVTPAIGEAHQSAAQPSGAAEVGVHTYFERATGAVGRTAELLRHVESSAAARTEVTSRKGGASPKPYALLRRRGSKVKAKPRK